MYDTNCQSANSYVTRLGVSPKNSSSKLLSNKYLSAKKDKKTAVLMIIRDLTVRVAGPPKNKCERPAKSERNHSKKSRPAVRDFHDFPLARTLRGDSTLVGATGSLAALRRRRLLDILSYIEPVRKHSPRNFQPSSLAAFCDAFFKP
jgi:hypothetical protein